MITSNNELGNFNCVTDEILIYIKWYSNRLNDHVATCQTRQCTKIKSLPYAHVWKVEKKH